MSAKKKPEKPANQRAIIVIGGGPAGMSAALAAARHHKNVMLFDKNPQPGKKILSIPSANVIVAEELSLDKTVKAYGDKEAFVKPSLKAFGWKDLIEHLRSLGIETTSNGSSHLAVTPETATEFPARLKNAAEAQGVVIRKSSRVLDIIINGNEATGVIVNGVEYPASAVIVACGSYSSPGSGSTKDGYNFAQKAGHSVVPIKPAMVGLVTVEKYGKLLADAEFRNCKIDIYLDGKHQLGDRGNLRFTSYGIEGDLILNHSASIIEMLKKGKVEIHIDMVPDLSRKDLETKYVQEAELYNKATVGDLLEKYVSKQLLSVLGKITRIHADKPVTNLSYLERKSLLLWIKDFHLTVKRPRPFNETRGVLGGVCLDEIDSATMRSRKIKNLYFAGDVMDILGPWGGYNIQMAFSTGNLAGTSAAKALEE